MRKRCNSDLAKQLAGQCNNKEKQFNCPLMGYPYCIFEKTCEEIRPSDWQKEIDIEHDCMKTILPG